MLRSATFCAVCFFLLPLFLCSYAYPRRYRFPWILLAIVAVNHHQSTMTTCFSCQSRARPRGLKGECPREEGGVTLWIAIVCTRGMCVCVCVCVCVRACVRVCVCGHVCVVYEHGRNHHILWGGRAPPQYWKNTNLSPPIIGLLYCNM